MMLRPSMSEVLKDGESYYSFVIAVAKRARDISAAAEEERVSLDEKPMNIAVRDFASEKFKVADSATMQEEID